jgi:exosome complex exonuclease RRP6
VQGLPLEDDFAFQASFPEFTSQLSSTKAALLDVLAMALPSLGTVGDNEDLFSTDDVDDDDPFLWEKCAEACDALVEDVEFYLEQANNNKTKTISSVTSTAKQWDHWSARARQRAQGTLRLMEQGLVDMVKPQITYNITVQNDRLLPFVPRVHPDKPYNVTPLDLSLQPGHGLDTRMASIKSINSNSTDGGTVASRFPDNVIAPPHHVAHVYQTEIESFTYRPWQLVAHEPPKGTTISVVDPLEATWIDTESALEQLAAKLATKSHVAIDLEAHSHRTFSGLTCLMQLSFRENDTTGPPSSPSKMENYLLDPFALGATAVTKHLAAMFANPDIVKVMHGADWDIGWLQRDFGLYVVNLFDTGRAARALRFTSAGYAYLLHHYVGIDAEKRHQLSDWRQRPLPPDMRQYAIRDTHYLLDIYDRLKWDLEQNPDTSIMEVLDVSRKVCLIRYDKEPFQPNGYRWLLAGRGRRQQQSLTPAQERVLAALWDWRDETARECDESLLYMCPNPSLLRLSLASPTTVTALQGVLNPIPPLLLRQAPQVVDRIKQALLKGEDEGTKEKAGVDVTSGRAPPPPSTPTSAALLEEDDDEVANSSNRRLARQVPAAGAPSSAYFKPAEMPSSDRPDHGRSILSPVLGTEALYQQAGWMTPLNHPGAGGRAGRRSSDQEDENDDRDMELVTTAPTTSDDDDCDQSSKPKHLLAVDKANQNFKAAEYMPHSLVMKVGEHEQTTHTAATADAGRRRGRSVDGLGPTRAARERSKSPIPLTAEDQARQAQQAAARVRISLSRKEDDLAMVSPSTELNDEDDDEGEELGVREQEGDKESGVVEDEAEEEFVIPRSLKEIYKISNQNRRNKKSSPPPDRSGGVQSNETEMNALAQAEALLKARGLNGKGYFESGDGAMGSKRQRTKSTESESEDSPNASDGANNNSGSNNNSGNVSRDDDIAFMQEMGWIQNKEEAEKLLEQRQGERAESGVPDSSTPGEDDNAEEEETRRVSSSNSNNRSRDNNSKHPHQQQPSPAFDYSTVGTIGAFPSQTAGAPSNPFFAGAALTGGALAQGFGRGPERKRSGGRGSGGRQQSRPRERPEKKDGRTQVYKKK